MTNYERGYRFELRVRRFLESLAFLVIRSAGSKGPADLAAFGRGRTLLFACKVDPGDFTVGQTSRLRAMARAGGAQAWVAWREGKKLRFREMDVANDFVAWKSGPMAEGDMRLHLARLTWPLIWRPDEEPLPPWYQGEKERSDENGG